MDKKYLKETSEMFLQANIEDVRESDCLYVKIKDVYKIAEMFFGESYVAFIADNSQGESSDNLNKLDFISKLINYMPELSGDIKDRIIYVNALRKRHMEIDDKEDELDKIKEALESEEDAIKEALKEMGLVPEEDEDEEEEEEIYSEF